MHTSTFSFCLEFPLFHIFYFFSNQSCTIVINKSNCLFSYGTAFQHTNMSCYMHDANPMLYFLLIPSPTHSLRSEISIEQPATAIIYSTYTLYKHCRVSTQDLLVYRNVFSESLVFACRLTALHQKFLVYPKN